MRRACRPSPAWLRWALPVCAAVLLAPRPTSGQCAGPAFGPVAGPTVSGEPWGVVVGDFWGVTGEPDGTLDVVVTKRSANVVTLLRGDGLGSFMAPIDFAVGTGPTDLVVADFNGDGLLDLAAVVAAQALPPVARVELLAGTGSGFGAPVPLDVVDLPSRLAVGDFNRDDKPDLVVVSWSAETVQVYAGNGALGFNLQAPQPIIPGDTPTAAVAGDFNRDGQPDLAVSLDNVGPVDEVLIYLGDGTGHLGDTPSTEDPFATITVGTTPLDIRAGDVNRDGKPDLVTADLASVAISVLIGAGNGTFTREPGSPAVGAGPIRAVLEDFDRDGLLDVATLNPPGGPPHVTVLPGTAVPPFFDAGSPTTLLLSPASTHEGLAAGDLDADGRPDLVATEGTDGNVVVALNTASPDCPRASFGDAPRAFFAGDGPVSVAVADLDEDGHDDLVSAAYSGNTLEVLRGSGNGYSRSGGVPLPGFPRGVAAADFNVDGHADIVAAFGNQVQLFLGDGTGALVGGGSAGAGTLTSAVVAGDFDGNGTPDVVATSQATGEVYFFPGDALGGLGAARITPVGTGPRALAAGYLNAGGVLDLVVANSGANSVSVLLGNGDGSFSVSTLPMAPGKGPWGIALGSFDGGGTLDIVTADHDASPASVTVWLGAGDGTFGSPTSHTVPGVFPFAVAALDVTDDSNDDITVVTGSDALVLLVGDGGASFAAPVEFPVRTRPSEIAALDADADGRPDLAIPCRDADSVVVLLARPPVAPLFSEATKVAVGANPTDIATADLDRDGDLDLAVANSTGGTVSILRNDSLGAFSVSATPAAGASPAAVVAADFDRDGILDLAVANREDPNGTVSVLRGLGGGAFDTAESAVPFLPPYELEVLELPDDLAVGDFDSDGSLEIAVVNEAADTVTLIGIDPRVPFPASPPYFDFSFGGTFPVGESPTSIFAADLDRDGNLDLAVANLINVAPPLDDDLTVLFGDGTGDFPDIRNLALSSGTSPLSVTAGDFDLDGDLDLAAAVFGSDEIALFENQGARVFSSPGIAIPASYLPQFLTTADVNRDGKPDLALAASGFAVRRGRCSPPAPCPLGLVFEDSEDFIAGRNSAALVVADLSGDGLPDAALVNKDSDDVSILLSTACVRRRLVVSASPAACGMGAPPFPMTALVEVQDDGANKLICESGTISASIAPGTGPVGAILGGTLDIVVSSGEASFGDLNIDREGPRYRLQFDLSGVPSALSRSFTLGPDIAIAGPPSFCGLSSGAYSVATGYDRYLWTVDGTPASGSPSVLLVNPPLAPSLPQEVGLGPHTLAVGARVDGCLATDSKSIYVGDLASVSITPTGATTVCVDCLGGTVTTAQTGGGAPLGHQWGYRTVPMTGPITSIVGQTGDTYVVNGLDFPGVGTFYLVETTTPTCGSPVTSSNEVAVTITATVPGGEVQSLGATSRGTPGAGQNVLQWVNSVGTPDEIRIRWNKAPTGSTICAPPPDPVTPAVSGSSRFSPPFFVHDGLAAPLRSSSTPPTATPSSSSPRP